jgi:hypothetical protein
MNDSVSIASKFSPIGVRGFRETAAARIRFPEGPSDERGVAFDRGLSGRGNFKGAYDFGAIMPSPRSARSTTGESGNSFLIC